MGLSSFLQKIVISLVVLLKSGADREPEIMEQVKSINFLLPYVELCVLSY